MMLQRFTYPVTDDQDIYRRMNVSILNKAIFIIACTIAGSKDGINRKPNEDSFSILKNDKRITIAVFDGSSSQKPIPSLTESGARFASHFLKTEFETEKHGEEVDQIFRNINKTLLKRNLEFPGATLKDINSMPASTATLAQIDFSRNVFKVSHVGDTFCMILFKDGHGELITIDKNKKYDDEILQKMGKVAVDRNITPREARKDPLVSQLVAEMFQKTHNKPDGTGQGIMNGDPNVKKYIQDITLPISTIDAFLLGSDGLIPPGWDETKQESQIKLFKIASTKGVKGLIMNKKQIEDNDPDWQLLRYKHSDDATAVYLKL